MRSKLRTSTLITVLILAGCHLPPTECVLSDTSSGTPGNETSVSEPKLDRCLGLVLKGGANKGSYEAGAIYTLIRNLPQEDVEYRVISGVSVGALSAAHIASYPIGEERKMADDLLTLWLSMSKENMYQSWSWGIIEGLIREAGILDSTPLHQFIRDYMAQRTMHRMVHFNSVDAITGDVITFDETVDKETFLTGLMGSAAVPFVFPPVPFQDKLLMDGGVVWNLDIASAVRKCRQLVDSDSKIILDVIDLDRSLSVGPPSWKSEGDSIQNYFRLRKWRDYYQRVDDEVEIRRAFPEVQYRYVIAPKVSLDHTYQELSMDPRLIQKLINLGMQDALEAIKSKNAAE